MKRTASESRTNKSQQSERSLWQRLFAREGMGQAVLLPLLSVFTALLIGAVIIAFSNVEIIAAWKNLFSSPMETLKLTWQGISHAYQAMFEGAFGIPSEMAKAYKEWKTTGETRPLLEAFRPISESLVIATPYIFAGLGVALGFRGGMFNIGAEGQLFAAGLVATLIGYSVKGLPIYIHMPLAVLGGALGGALWASIPGALKAKTGAHEVINTIMMNYIAFRLTDYLLSGPMMRPDGLPISRDVLPSAYIPPMFAPPMRLHWGFIFALVMAWVVYWFLWKTPLGMEIRMVGANPKAARYAGVRNAMITVLTMALSGALAGMAGVGQILGVNHNMVRAFSTGYGFDAIALALLGNSHPLGVVLSSLLFGFLRGGAARMQSVADVPVELIRIIQGLVIVFIAAPEIIRSLYRIKEKKQEGPTAKLVAN
ncbi:MAG TPA: ABC transporter permease [Anaerolineales bacterium]|nr:ABC transporter permease [Anaerolineales bacterium]